MAKIVIIRDEGGIAGLELREQSLLSKGYTVIKAIGDARAIVRGSDRVVVTRDIDYLDRRQAANEVLASDRFTPEEKEEFYALLSGRTFHLDVYSQEYIPGYYDKLHKVDDAPGKPTYPPIVRVVDP